MNTEATALELQVLRFVALLRSFNLIAGTGQAQDAIRALLHLDLSSRRDVYFALRAVLLDRHTHETAFNALFERFWMGLAPLLETYTENIPAQEERRQERAESRESATQQNSLETLVVGGETEEATSTEESDGAGDAADELSVAYSAAEVLRQKDFAHANELELAELRRLLSGLTFTPPRRLLRRSEAARHGQRLDLRRLVRRNLRYGGELLVLPRRRRKTQARPVALIADISGSMDRYTRLLLRFLHATTHGLENVETFLFATRLTRITHQLRSRDPDLALDEVAREVQDFSGGTRIGESISTFNRQWARRALGRGAIVIIISDGWDRGDPRILAAEMAHLRRSCHLLVWLNPLLGLEGYQPLMRGMKAALPSIDLFLPAHNVASLQALAVLLAQSVLRHDRPVRQQRAYSS